MKRLILFILVCSPGIWSLASEKGKISADFEVLSRHYWRGSQMGDAPAFEPNVTFSKGGFSFSVWGAVTANESYTELDLIPSYSLGNFTAILFDYYNPVSGEDNRFLDFSEEKSRHSVEVAIDYNGEGSLPVKVYAGTFFYGDKNPESGNPYYSTYTELAYPFVMLNTKFETHVGFTPFEGYYARKFAVVSTGIEAVKSIKIAPSLEMPVRLSFLVNPHTSKAFFIFGLGISKI